ncbi:MAG: glycosyltransferase family 4 protein [Candidatus Levybacteria bacterium]|nr:glycosyltransferase family 4 protein [Candidatus Levybacteria bacterium]
MKILHLTDHLPEYHQPWGGAEKVAYRHISALIEKEKKWKFFVGTTKTLKEVKEKFKYIRVWTIEDFFPKRFHLYITGFKNQVFPFDPITFFSTYINVRKIMPDVIHIHKANKISFAPVLVGKLLGIPVVLAIYDYWYFCPGAMLIDEEANSCHRFHGIWCSSCTATKKFGFTVKITSLYRRPLFDFFFSMISAFLVLSESNVRLLSEYGIDKKKIFVVRQLFYPPKEKIKNKIREGDIYMNAWMAPHKGVHIVVQSFAEVLKKVPQARLYLETKVLDPVYEAKIKKMIKKLKIENHVDIFERKTVADYIERIQKANVVVVAEQWENMAPTTLSDSMSQGKPVVASNIGGLPEMVEDGKSGLLANSGEPKDFADKIVRIIKSPSLAASLAKNAPKSIEKLGSLKNIQKQLLQLYASVSSSN